jgi:hypothetical protein
MEAAAKAAELIAKTSYKEIGSAEFRTQEEIINEFEGAYYANGVNIKNPTDKDLARYYANIRRLQFDRSIPDILKNAIEFIPDMYAYSAALYNALTEHRTYKDGWHEDDTFYKAVEAIFEAKNEAELAEAEKEAVRLAAPVGVEHTVHMEENTMAEPDAEGYLKIYMQDIPGFKALINSYIVEKKNADALYEQCAVLTGSKEGPAFDAWLSVRKQESKTHDDIEKAIIKHWGGPYSATVQARGFREFFDSQMVALDKLAASPLGVEQNIFKKEKIMSDEYDEDEGFENESGLGDAFGDEGAEPEQERETDLAEPGAKLSREELAFRNTVHQRKQIAESLKNGSLPCLPGKDGYADTSPAVNITTGTRYHGASLLYLKDHQKRNGFPTAEYATPEAIQKAGVPIRGGEQSVSINFSEKNKGTGEWENKTVKLFNIAQTAKPWAVRKYAENLTAEKEQKRQNFLKNQFGESYKPREKVERESGPEIACTSTEPERYLGQYLAAVSLGGKFKVTEQQASEFAQKMEGKLYERNVDDHLDPFKLSKICNAAGVQCKEIIKEIKQPQPKQEQTQKIEQKHSRHM